MADNQFQIFEGVPVPAAKHGAGFGPRESKYPFKEMAVGDLLVVPDKSSKAFGGTVRAAEKSNSGYFFVIRTGPISDAAGNEVVSKGSLGVWRVAQKAERKPTKPRTPEQIAASKAKAEATRARNQAAKAAAKAAA